MKLKNIAQSVLLVLLLAAGFWLYSNEYAVRDWWQLRSYQAPAAIAKMADELELNQTGRNLFYVSKPEIDEKDAFNTNCPFPERSLVLGCYNAGRIYIFDVTDDRLDGIEEVTAAHEMLHAAYARLKPSRQAEVDAMVVDAFNQLNDDRINELVKTYNKDDPKSVPNELHSILGTEVRNLPSDLENYYKNYFVDRSVVVSKAEAYEQVFTEIQDQIADYDKQLSSLKVQITALESKLDSQKRELDSQSTQLKNLRQSGQITAYNSLVPGYNAAVNNYNSLINEYQSTVKQYNDMVTKRNELAATQNDLVQSLDSKYEPINN